MSKKVQTMEFEYDFGAEMQSLDVPPRIAKLQNTLNALPDGRFLDHERLAELSGVAYDSIRHDSIHMALRGYKVTHKHRTMWGNLKTVAAWKESHGAN